ncbi:MAG: transporter substrate-binding domain-containing protein [Spirochaetes bacterium]|nr:transporter substrate-binding domain-containing protein [Spirochaetota bacterium]
MKALKLILFFLILFVLLFSCNKKDKSTNQSTKTEETIIKETKTVKQELYLITLEWEPFIGTKLKNDGFIIEIVEKSFFAVGYQTIKIEYFPWKRCMEMGKNNMTDAIIGAWYNEERAKIYHYSEPMITNKKMFFKLKENQVINHYTTLKDLSAYSIGVIRGFTYSQEFDNADYLNKDECVDVAMLFKKLVAGRVDLVIDEYYTTLYILQNDLATFKPDIEVISPPLKEDPLYVIFPKGRKNSKQLRDQFNEGLNILKKNGQFDKILLKHGF